MPRSKSNAHSDQSARYILPLDSAEATLSRVGGKGANLVELIRAGFRVPPGFIVATNAYREFVSANRIHDQLVKIARDVSPDDPDALEIASQTIHKLFKKKTPPHIEKAVHAAYRDLSSGTFANQPVAVRSSATAEDLPGLSFAGQQDTYLNIVGLAALNDAVKSCWASLWTARAIGYRARNGIAPDDVSLAVVVQAMIPSEVSGIAFTANPLTGHRGEVAIDASFGLGEAIVSGQVEPDHYVVDKRTKQIVSRKLGAKSFAILPSKTGGTQSTTRERGQEQALSDAQILELAAVCSKIASHFGSPQDIEWGLSNGILHILQSRPITSLYPIPDSLLNSPDQRVLFSLNSLQGVVEPLTPASLDSIYALFKGALKMLGIQRPAQSSLITAGGRVYIDVTEPISDVRMRRVILGGLANADPGARQTADELIAAGRIPTRHTVGPANFFRLIWNFRHVILGAPLTWISPLSRRDRAIRVTEAGFLKSRDAIAKSGDLYAQLAASHKAISEALPPLIFVHIGPVMMPGIASMGLIDRWLVSWLGEIPGSVRKLMRGLPFNPTTEMDLKLWETRQVIHHDPATAKEFLNQPAAKLAEQYHAEKLPPSAQHALGDFLAEYGMRAVGEFDLGRPRWREDPRSIIETLKSYLAIDDPVQAPDRVFQQGAETSERLAEDYVARVREAHGTLRASILGAAIRRMRAVFGLRERPKFYMIKVFDLTRSILLKIGHELAGQKKLDKPDDIFFLHSEEILASRSENTELKTLVARRRADYDRELARKQIPRLMLSTGEVFYQGIGEAGSDDLVGDGVSPGMVEGRVRVVLDPRGAGLQPGEILVCPATDPGWTPLFLSAGGLVMELGGMMTHGSVVAREYGIPAVVGVHNVTQRLKTGQMVRVDGTSGRVLILDRDKHASIMTPKYVLHYWFEWGGQCLWGINDAAQKKFGYGLSYEELPLTSETIERMNELGRWFDTMLNWDSPMDPGLWRQEEHDRFFEAATQLYDTIVKELGNDFEVINHQTRSLEDPDLDVYLKDPNRPKIISPRSKKLD